ncbi:MAG TPA: LysR substrate-binding domain-containing protein, partial [Acidimicrobiales bacterium]|nr:LysR substrate-binding domain-containing protein [Acidimicrobiales bacterium]
LLLVAAGEGVALVPAATMHVHPVPGVRFAPVADAAAVSSAGMVWRADERSPAVGRLLDTTREVAAQHQSGPDVWPERQAAGG